MYAALFRQVLEVLVRGVQLPGVRNEREAQPGYPVRQIQTACAANMDSPIERPSSPVSRWSTSTRK